MNNYKLKKMLAEAGKDLKVAQEKYAEIERLLKNESSTNYVIVFKNGYYKKDFDKKITEFKSSMDAFAAFKDIAYKLNVNDISEAIMNRAISEGDVIAIPYEDETPGIDTVLPFNVCKITEKNKAFCHCRFALDKV